MMQVESLLCWVYYAQLQELFQVFCWMQHSTSRELKNTLNQSKKSAWEVSGSGLGVSKDKYSTQVVKTLQKFKRLLSLRAQQQCLWPFSPFESGARAASAAQQCIIMGLFSLAPNPSPPHGPVWWNQPCSDECCTFPVSTAPVCAGEEEGWPLPSRDSGVGWGRGERCTYSTQSAYAEAIDSLARTRKLPSLPTLESRSSALERVMLPWYQHWSIAGAGENLNANTGAARAACVSVCND